MTIKMIATDLDGTLFRDDKSVSDRTISALKKCREAGIKVVYATARGKSAETLISPELFDGFVRMGGAVAFAGEKLAYSKLISTARARDFLLAADRFGLRVAAELDGWSFANFKVDEVWDWLTYYEITDFHTLDIDAEKIYAVPETESELELLRRYLPDDLYMIRLINFMDNYAMLFGCDNNTCYYN